MLLIRTGSNYLLRSGDVFRDLCYWAPVDIVRMKTALEALNVFMNLLCIVVVVIVDEGPVCCSYSTILRSL